VQYVSSLKVTPLQVSPSVSRNTIAPKPVRRTIRIDAAANTETKPGIQRGQALAYISRSALCCHSNETGAPLPNPPNSVQLEGTPYHSPS